jgi:hypothetical protein
MGAVSETSPCEDCGRELAERTVTICDRRFVFRPRICDRCAEARDKSMRSKQASRWERLCPALYRDTDLCRVSDER